MKTNQRVPHESAIRKLEKLEAQARARGDLVALDGLWCEEFTVNTTENLILTKARFLSRMRTGMLGYLKFDRKIAQIVRKGDTIVTMGQETVIPATGSDAGRVVSISYLNVWISISHEWRLFARKA